MTARKFKHEIEKLRCDDCDKMICWVDVGAIINACVCDTCRIMRDIEKETLNKGGEK